MAVRHLKSYVSWVQTVKERSMKYEFLLAYFMILGFLAV